MGFGTLKKATTRKGSTLEEFFNPRVRGFRPQRAHEERPENQKRAKKNQKRPEKAKTARKSQKKRAQEERRAKKRPDKARGQGRMPRKRTLNFEGHEFFPLKTNRGGEK